MNAVKLLALDLDGTLLNSQKELTPRTCDACGQYPYRLDHFRDLP